MDYSSAETVYLIVIYNSIRPAINVRWARAKITDLHYTHEENSAEAL